MNTNRFSSLRSLPLFLLAANAGAATITYQQGWAVAAVGTNPAVAANCTFSYPTLQPLSQPRTLIVDEHLPNGAVLHSWGYADFAPNFSAGCAYAGTVTNNFVLSPGSITFLTAWAGVTSSTLSFKTNNPGIELKLYYTYHSQGNGTNNYYGNTTQFYSMTDTPGVEYPFPFGTTYIGATFYPVRNTATSPFTHYYDWAADNYTMSVRAELVKVGTVSYTATPLTLNASNTLSLLISGLSSVGTANDVNLNVTSDVLGGGGISIAAPSCQLTAPSDYAIDLGRWTHAGLGVFLPAYGSTRPINLKLECSGQLDNVRFSFQDTGTNSLSNRNVSVYDSLGGTKIDGLEIEMSYGGSPIQVNYASEAAASFIKTNTGAQGAVKTNPSDLSFNSQATIPFGARFVQRSAIQRSGSSYTGPVTGRVNMFVTYY